MAELLEVEVAARARVEEVWVGEVQVEVRAVVTWVVATTAAVKRVEVPKVMAAMVAVTRVVATKVVVAKVAVAAVVPMAADKRLASPLPGTR